MYISDVADAESICLGYLARIDDETFFFQLGVERIEIETCFRIKERGDDGRLEFVRQQGFEAECTHSFYQYAVVFAISLVAGGYSPLFFQFGKCLLEGSYYMGGRSKPPFAMSFLHRLPLVVNID